jgi:hypothetical protein
MPRLVLALLAATGCAACAEPVARPDLGGDGQGATEAGPSGCGDGRLEGSESCDGANLGGQSCATLGLGGGELRCTPGCRFDLGGCSSCGDGKLQGPEACDGANLGGQSCTTLGFPGGGALSCSKACQHDTGGCVARRPGHATLIYATASGLKELRLDTASELWKGPTPLPSIGGAKPAWVVNRISPKGEELVAASSVGTTLALHLLRQPAGGSWTLDHTTPLAIPASEASKRPFDLVHEASSGAALLVYSTNQPNPQYRTLVGGVWSAPKGVFVSPPGNHPVRWVRLAARPGSDEIALVFADARMDLYFVAWDGDAFRTGNSEKLTSDGSGYTGMGFETQSFDLAYEASGELLIAAGAACCSCLPTALKKPGEQKLSGSPEACSASWRLVRLVPQPAGDGIALLGDVAGAGLWDGGSFSQVERYWPGPGVQAAEPPRYSDTAWVGQRPVAIAVHRGWDDLALPGTGQLHWLRSLPDGTWQNGAPVKVAGLGELCWPQLRGYPAEERVLAVFADDQHRLRAASYDLIKGWSLLGANPLATDLAAFSQSLPAPRTFSVEIRQ